MITHEHIEAERVRRSPDGTTKMTDVTNYDKIQTIMEEALKHKIWWFAWEFVGKTHTHKHGQVFISYEISARLAEMVNDGILVTVPSNGRMNLYRLNDELLGLN